MSTDAKGLWTHSRITGDDQNQVELTFDTPQAASDFAMGLAYQCNVEREAAATRMRDRCMEKVRARVKQLACTCVGERADHHARCPIMIGAEMVTDLQSLTLEQGEQEKQENDF